MSAEENLFEVNDDGEVSVTWEATDEGTVIVISLGEASITIEASPDGWGQNVGLMVTALPQILEAAWTAIESDDNQEEE